ncbi:unnamed protein product [Microthlaspi erraticum]|uniref:Uncharacterized protein n=1 Tax=Microthlaspi erraticum TaxID=1685480 RepID=A0A6D2JDG1_9BRAS|nr:unnamed protein product [Microthlaspi erraticum]
MTAEKNNSDSQSSSHSSSATVFLSFSSQSIFGHTPNRPSSPLAYSSGFGRGCSGGVLSSPPLDTTYRSGRDLVGFRLLQTGVHFPAPASLRLLNIDGWALLVFHAYGIFISKELGGLSIETLITEEEICVHKRSSDVDASISLRMDIPPSFNNPPLPTTQVQEKLRGSISECSGRFRRVQ